MLPIRTLSAPAVSATAPRTLAPGGGQFALAADPPHAAAVAGGGAAVPLDMLLAVQEAEAPGEASGAVRDRRAKRHGRAMLEALAGLQRGLAGPGGGLAAEALHRLADLVAHPQEAADPALGAIVAQIALRARIELARYSSV